MILVWLLMTLSLSPSLQQEFPGYGRHALHGSERWPTVRPKTPSQFVGYCGLHRKLRIRLGTPMAITLRRDLFCKGGKDIRAEAPVVILGGAIRFVNVSGFRVAGLCFVDSVDDSIEVRNSTRGVIQHNSFYNSGDGAIDIVHASTDISVLGNRFVNVKKASLVGGSDLRPEDRSTRASFYSNVFRGCKARGPRLRWGMVHACNNVYSNYSSYAIGGSRHGVVAVQFCHFDSRHPFKRFDTTLRIYASNNSFPYAPLVKGPRKDIDGAVEDLRLPEVCRRMDRGDIVKNAGSRWC